MKSKRLAFILLLVLVPVFALLFWSINKKGTKNQKMTSVPPKPLPTPAPEQIVIPSIPPVMIPPSEESRRPSGRFDYATYAITQEYAQIHMRLFPPVNRLLNSHPSPQVRDDLIKAMNEQSVGAMFFDQSNPIGRGIAVAAVMRVPGRGPIPVICFSAENILSSSVDTRQKQATIYHELMHVLQFRDGYMPEQFYPMGPESPFTKQAAADYFELEYEAYVLECRFSIKQGWVSIDPMYADFAQKGEKAFRKMLPTFLASIQPRLIPHLKHLANVARKRRTIRPRKRLSEVPLVIKPD